MDAGTILGIVVGGLISVAAWAGTAVWVMSRLKALTEFADSRISELRGELQGVKSMWSDESKAIRSEFRELVGEVRGDLKAAEREIRDLGKATAALSERDRELSTLRQRILGLEASHRKR